MSLCAGRRSDPGTTAGTKNINTMHCRSQTPTHVRRALVATMVVAATVAPSPRTFAQPTDDVPTLDPVVVTATRRAARSFDVAASTDRIDAATIQNGQPMINLSETLVRVPGIVTFNRQNYAQDLQIS